MQFISFNGKILEAATPVIRADNRGLRYGDGLFETMKFSNDRLILVDEHLSRLWSGMKAMSFEIPKLFTPDSLEKEILELLKKNKLQHARVRLTVFRGSGGLYDAVSYTPKYMIETWSLPSGNSQLNENGLQCCVYADATKSCDSFSRYKHNNFLPYLLGAIHAKEQKCNDAIIINQYNRICDSTIANIFTIKDGTIHTPALSEGCIAGVMRAFIISVLKKNNIHVEEKQISQDELLVSDEVFLSNSIYNMRWVAGIENSSFSHSSTREIFQLLQRTNPDVFC